MDTRKIWKLLEHYSCGQIQEQIEQGKHYFQRGEENLPIDVSSSIRFLNDLEGLLDLFWQSGKDQKILHSRPGPDRAPVHEETMEDFFQDAANGIKILQSEMRMILTQDNMVFYKDFIGFVDTLMEVHGD